ncbi:helix-turn-helix domain-containing protein, partial [Acinetobacter baumannii]
FHHFYQYLSMFKNSLKQLIQELKNIGLLEIKKAVETVAQHLGISRASAYLYVKET